MQIQQLCNLCNDIISDKRHARRPSFRASVEMVGYPMIRSCAPGAATTRSDEPPATFTQAPPGAAWEFRRRVQMSAPTYIGRSQCTSVCESFVD